MVMIMVMNMLT